MSESKVTMMFRLIEEMLYANFFHCSYIFLISFANATLDKYMAVKKGTSFIHVYLSFAVRFLSENWRLFVCP